MLKALTSLPSNDFTLCLYLLSEEQHQEPRIKILIELFHEIEKCRFDDVWEFLVSIELLVLFAWHAPEHTFSFSGFWTTRATFLVAASIW